MKQNVIKNADKYNYMHSLGFEYVDIAKFLEDTEHEHLKLSSMLEFRYWLNKRQEKVG